MKPNLIIIGAGGHAKVVADTADRQSIYAVLGFLDPKIVVGTQVLSWTVLGDDEALSYNSSISASHFIVGFGGHQSTRHRIEIFSKALDCGLEPGCVIHPRADVSRFALVEPGTVVFAGAIVNASAVISSNVIVNTRAVIEHDVTIANHVQISSGAVLAGGVVVEQGAFIGAGATILPGIRVGAFSIVGAGAVVTRNVSSGLTITGVPARPISLDPSSPS